MSYGDGWCRIFAFRSRYPVAGVSAADDYKGR
jgi:hypothetical protein